MDIIVARDKNTIYKVKLGMLIDIVKYDNIMLLI